MKEVKVMAILQVFDHLDELPTEAKHLMAEAIKASEQAYAPYSKFRVGAALSLDNGQIVVGNNQENAAYPSGLCAERVAIFHAGANYPKAKVRAIAVTASSDTTIVDKPVPPCGACRQSIAEYEQKQDAPIAIYFMGETGKIVKASSLSDLLPLVFDSSYL